ncbi:hypothetical protein HZH66_011803 [Vespula vulgaris]|uniref:Uncharacterized protein n=1 Tax=Vespula vulgaris TaxID=7454 RepID=A0A834JE22_VESVU|nr:hypothetical protein HZH66_011803 [Vespula vulgaris]
MHGIPSSRLLPRRREHAGSFRVEFNMGIRIEDGHIRPSGMFGYRFQSLQCVTKDANIPEENKEFLQFLVYSIIKIVVSL